ncbi:MAG: PQQ-binding-like beta-propeller repeat protein [Akkermansiaceae bacterium]|nr:PQQ-binding-like beta-propeller repeat protein [Akkermansiaceae bacterium]
MAGLLLGLVHCEGRRDAGNTPPAEPPAAASAEVPWTPDWPMSRGGGRLNGRVAGPAPRQPVIEWTFQNTAAITSEAAIAEGLIVFGDTEGGIQAVEVATRKRRWQVATKDAVEATPAIAGGRVFAGSNDGVFRALDVGDGHLLWSIEGGDKFPTGATLTTGPDASGPVLLVNGYDGVSHCLRPADGSEVWRHETNDYINGSPVLLDGGRIAFGGCDARLHMLLLKDGSAVGELESEAQIIRSLAAWGRTLYGVNYANQLLAAAWDASGPAWLYEADGNQFLTSPAADEERVYVGCRDKHLYAVDRLTGKLRWKFKTGGRVASAPLVFDDAVVFGSSDGRLYAVAVADGMELWRLELGEDLAVAPSHAGGRIVIGGGEGTLFVIRGGAAR